MFLVRSFSTHEQEAMSGFLNTIHRADPTAMIRFEYDNLFTIKMSALGHHFISYNEHDAHKYSGSQPCTRVFYFHPNDILGYIVSLDAGTVEKQTTTPTLFFTSPNTTRSFQTHIQEELPYSITVPSDETYATVQLSDIIIPTTCASKDYKNLSHTGVELKVFENGACVAVAHSPRFRSQTNTQDIAGIGETHIIIPRYALNNVSTELGFNNDWASIPYYYSHMNKGTIFVSNLAQSIFHKESFWEQKESNMFDDSLSFEHGTIFECDTQDLIEASYVFNLFNDKVIKKFPQKLYATLDRCRDSDGKTIPHQLVITVRSKQNKVVATWNVTADRQKQQNIKPITWVFRPRELDTIAQAVNIAYRENKKILCSINTKNRLAHFLALPYGFITLKLDKN